MCEELNVVEVPLDREKMYKDGGLFSVSSTILITDMLKGSVPVDLVTGMVVMHAERYVAVA